MSTGDDPVVDVAFAVLDGEEIMIPLSQRARDWFCAQGMPDDCETVMYDEDILGEMPEDFVVGNAIVKELEEVIPTDRVLH